MDLTEAFTAFLAPSARPMTADELNQSVDTFVTAIGGFPALLTLLQSQTEDAAEDLMFSDIMRRTAARVFSAPRGLELLSADNTVPFLLPLVSSAPEPIFRVILDGLEHCIRYHSRSPPSPTGSRWRVPSAVYNALLSRCRVADADVFREIAAFVALDSVANDAAPRRVLLRTSMEALAGGPLSASSTPTGPTGAAGEDEGPLKVSAIGLGSWADFAAVVAPTAAAAAGGRGDDSNDMDGDDGEDKPVMTRAELAAARARESQSEGQGQGQGQGAVAERAPLTVGVEVFRTRIIDLLLIVAAAHDAAAAVAAASSSSRVTPGSRAADSGVLSEAQKALAAAELPQALTSLAFPGGLSSAPASASASSSVSGSGSGSAGRVDPLTVLVSLALLARWGRTPAGSHALTLAGVPALAHSTLLHHCPPFAPLPVPAAAAATVPVLAGRALEAAAAEAAAAVGAGAADAALDADDEAAVVGQWFTQLPGLPAAMVAAGVIGVLTGLAKGAVDGGRDPVATLTTTHTYSPPETTAASSAAKAAGVGAGDSRSDRGRGDRGRELAALLCGYSRIPSLHGAVGGLIAALATSPRGLLWALSPAGRSYSTEAGAGAGASPLGALVSLAFVYEDATRAGALHAIAEVIAPREGTKTAISGLVGRHADGNDGEAAAAEFVRMYVLSILAAPRPPSAAALARVAAAAAAIETAAGAAAAGAAGAVQKDVAAAIPHAIASLMTSARSVLEELQFASLDMLRAIASRPWGARALLRQQGFDQFLVSKLDASSHESLKLNFDWKQQIARLLVASPAFTASSPSSAPASSHAAEAAGAAGAAGAGEEAGVGLSTFERGRIERFARAGSMAEATAGAVEDPMAQMG